MYDEALKCFDKALKLKKDHPEALEWSAYSFEKKNMLVQALNTWNALGRVKDLSEEKKQLVQERVNNIMNAVKF